MPAQLPPDRVRRAVSLRSRRAQRRRTATVAVAANGLMWALALVLLIPLLWIIASSLRPPEDLLSTDPSILPKTFSTENYSRLLDDPRFGQSMLNSAIVSLVVTTVGSYLAAMAGYAFALFRFRGRNALFAAVLAMLTVPLVATVIPNYVVMAELGLLNSLWALILPQLATPFAIFWMRQYIADAISPSLLEAARLDGASEFRIFQSVVLPNVKAGIAGVAIWLFLSSWNNLILPLTYVQTDDKQTYPLYLTTLRGTLGEQTLNLVVAASVLSCIPIVALFIVAQRHFVAGATGGAVKG
jgi:lactose/L-arabinose transport system permease protein